MVVPVSASTHGTDPRERGCFNCEIDTQDVIGDDCEREYPFQHHVLRAWGATLRVVTNPLVVSECTAPERGICEIGSLGLANLSHLILVIPPHRAVDYRLVMMALVVIIIILFYGEAHPGVNATLITNHSVATL